VFWYPTRTYSYTLAPVDVPGDLVAAEALRAKFRAGVIANAGAGKL